MAKKIMMVAKTMEKPTNKTSEPIRLSDEEMEELCNSLVRAINARFHKLKSIYGEDVLKSLAIAVTVFWMHQSSLTSKTEGTDEKVLFDALVDSFIKRINYMRKSLLEGGAWPN